jgi:hypothetical protein
MHRIHFLFPLLFHLVFLTLCLPPTARRLLSTRDGLATSNGTKRRLDDELQILKTASISSLTAVENIAQDSAETVLQQHHQISASEEFESMLKRAKKDPENVSQKAHSSAFDLVDDALHISSDDEFEIPALPSKVRNDIAQVYMPLS